MASKPRPQWAKKLTVSQWRHLVDAQMKATPTLRDLKIDADICGGCRLILEVVEGNR
jgi:hypothetical protein